MKRTMLVAVAAITIVIAMVGGVYAASIPTTVNVTGSVGGVCKAGTVGAMQFSIDPSSTGLIPAVVTTDATVFCTNNTAFTVTAASLNKALPAASCASPGGITGTLKDGTNTMDYTFTCGTAAGTGLGFAPGNSRPLSIGGSIAQAAYQNAPASALYGDTITLTITY